MSEKRTKKDTRTRKQLLDIIENRAVQYRRNQEQITELKNTLEMEVDHANQETERANKAEIQLVRSGEDCTDLRLALCQAKRIITALTDASVNYVVRTHKESAGAVMIRETRIVRSRGDRDA